METIDPSTLAKTFKMINPNLKLEVTISYINYSHLDNVIVSCCAVFEILSSLPQNSDAERISVMKATGYSNWNETASVGYSEDMNNLQYFSLVGSRFSGCTIRFDNIEISGIDFKEINNLLEFFKNMAGIKLRYIADIFGFLNNSGKDKAVIYELPFL
jgi:hypothetical protein